MMPKKTFWLVFSFLLVNFIFFLCYRLFFLVKFAPNSELSQFFPVFLSGLRLDAALLCFELFLMLCFALLRGQFFLRFSFLYLWGLSFLHFFFCLANIIFFEERNQTLGESFIAYITSPYEIYIAAAPFVRDKLFTISVALLLSILFFYYGFRVARKFFSLEVVLWKSIKKMALVVLFGFLCIAANLDQVTVKKSKSARGWKWAFTHSKYYTQSENFIFNQAIPNPWYDFFRVNIPTLFVRSLPYQLEKQRALQVCLETLNHKPENSDYPLLRTISSDFSFGLENVVLLQVEGLSQVFVDWQDKGKDIMPYLKRLSQEGIYFPHIFQSFNATSGGVFSTATSFHKACFEEKTRTFSTSELSGYFGCLSQILGNEEYNHYFAKGFRQNANEFITFMGNQGYTSFSYHDFQRRLAITSFPEPTEGLLGIFDSYFFMVCSQILDGCNKKFTAHFITTTSHSPWTVPESFSSPFDNDVFTAFYYVDYSIENFIKSMQSNKERFDRTLFVIVADHASLAKSEDFLERIRIPMILYSPKLSSFPNKEKFQKIYGCQVDILPTILDILGGERTYSGLGESLLREKAEKKGVLGGARDYGYYIKDGFFFQYFPSQKQTLLFKIQNNQILLKDLSSEYPKIKEQMRIEYFAQSETSQRLILEKRTFPRKNK